MTAHRRHNGGRVSRRTFLAASAAASASALVPAVVRGGSSAPARGVEPAESVAGDRRWWVATHRGLYAGIPGGNWQLQGAYTGRLTGVLRADTSGGFIVCGGAGVWSVPADGGWWTQLHDETLTELHDLAAIDGDPGLLAASAYGVATGRRDENDAVRWRFHSDGMPPDDRFSSAVVVRPEHWIVGTEAGVLTRSTGSTEWVPAVLRDTPVRVLREHGGRIWAGTDRRGVWVSDEGRQWEPVGEGLDETPVFDLAFAGDDAVAATETGVHIGDHLARAPAGAGAWHRVGPRQRVATIGVWGTHWLAGADPGGLWHSADAGASWHPLEGLPERIGAILPPAETT